MLKIYNTYLRDSFLHCMEQNIYKFFIVVGIILVISFAAKKYVWYMDDATYQRNEENKLIYKYLLNVSNIEKSMTIKKPKLWIHIDYAYNSRNWESFGSRSNFDLNQPYIHLTIKSIILHCGDDFEILLINDESFQTLLPDWEINMSGVAGVLKTQCQDYGMACILCKYGGMVVPSTFLCLKSLLPFYEECLENGLPFIMEKTNCYGTTKTIVDLHLTPICEKTPSIKSCQGTANFVPDPSFMGTLSNHPTIEHLKNLLLQQIQKPQLSNESEFLGTYSCACKQMVMERKMRIVDGRLIGIKTNTKQRAILIDDILGDGKIDFYKDMYGIYIDEKNILKRQKWQWFSCITVQELLKQNMVITRYFIDTIVNYRNI